MTDGHYNRNGCTCNFWRTPQEQAGGIKNSCQRIFLTRISGWSRRSKRDIPSLTGKREPRSIVGNSSRKGLDMWSLKFSERGGGTFCSRKFWCQRCRPFFPFAFLAFWPSRVSPFPRSVGSFLLDSRQGPEPGKGFRPIFLALSGQGPVSIPISRIRRSCACFSGYRFFPSCSSL